MRKLLLLICLWVGCLITPQETKAQDISILQKSKRREFLQESFLKVFQNGKLSVSGRKKSFPKFNVKSYPSYHNILYLCIRFRN